MEGKIASATVLILIEIGMEMEIHIYEGAMSYEQVLSSWVHASPNQEKTVQSSFTLPFSLYLTSPTPLTLSPFPLINFEIWAADCTATAKATADVWPTPFFNEVDEK